ncbi:MAG: hypothetical protein KIT46_07530 [Anaerolineales bacterium]|nr:hypothetical protein [Anaerolineales bacterium]MCW5855880.1 hypothetical protein [Anaerolineales bacterium]
MQPITFLKLGGSLLTHKDQPATSRPEVIQRAAGEIAAARRANPDLRLLLGHGSGSFGHVPAKQHNTRAGVRNPADWLGFVEVWRQAGALNRLVMDALAKAGLPAIAFPPSAAGQAQAGHLAAWQSGPLQAALDAGLLPVVYGDVVFDAEWGGTIASTEDVFVYLAPLLQPSRILLAGDEDGVYAGYGGVDARLLPELSAADRASMGAGAAAGADVTGGMAGKVGAMFPLLDALPDCEIRIFSGLRPGNLAQVLAGEPLGTRLFKV